MFTFTHVLHQYVRACMVLDRLNNGLLPEIPPIQIIPFYETCYLLMYQLYGTSPFYLSVCA